MGITVNMARTFLMGTIPFLAFRIKVLGCVKELARIILLVFMSFLARTIFTGSTIYMARRSIMGITQCLVRINLLDIMQSLARTFFMGITAKMARIYRLL